MNQEELAEFDELVKKLPKVEKKVKDNNIMVRVDGGLFRAVMSVAYKYGNQNMSEVVRKCIVASLDEVAEQLKKETADAKEARSKFAKSKNW
jgi:mRNA-degrading endonuclease HigB of HigAB toxin-antitoxin module